MWERHNWYLATAAILSIVYMLVPFISFNNGATLSIFGLVQFIPSTAYGVYVGAVGSVLLAILIFVAVPLYRDVRSQKSLVIAAIVINALLYLFAFAKYLQFLSIDQIKALHPSFGIGVIMPIGIFLLLSAAVISLNRRLKD